MRISLRFCKNSTLVVGKRQRSYIETKVHPIFSMATFQPLSTRQSFLTLYRGHATLRNTACPQYVTTWQVDLSSTSWSVTDSAARNVCSATCLRDSLSKTANWQKWKAEYGFGSLSTSSTVPPRVVTRTYSSFGDREFGAAGPGLSNSLPTHLKDADISYSELNSAGRYRHFCLDSGGTAQCKLY